LAGLIEDYALVGDMHSAALVGRDGSIDWLCLPRFDSGAVFASLLGESDNGHWQIGPVGGGDAQRRTYRDDTLVLESEWDVDGGTVRVIDFMPPRDEVPNLVRIVEGVRGTVRMESVLRLRFDYGHIVPWVRHVDGFLAAVAGPDSVWLAGDVPHHGRDFASIATFDISAGERRAFVMTWHPSHCAAPQPVEPLAALRDTEQFWRDWTSRCTYEGPYRDAVVQSLIVLKALTYQPTGGIVAAATSSLPEHIGGVRNWDYRYCWLRDATLTLQAFVRSGYLEEATAWREWLLRAVAGSPGDVQVLYGVAGDRRLPEWEAEWLSGYEGSRPVRFGNGAAGQLQLDVYGEVMTALAAARMAGMEPSPEAWRLQRRLLEFLEGIWREPDEGLWEVRGPRRHFTHSKVMVWAAFDAGVRAVEEGRDGPVERWRAERDAVRADVLREAYDSDRATFTQSYGSTALDAATLLIPQIGFLPYDDPRVVGTVDAVQKGLAADGFLLRYGSDALGHVDGLPGDEGAFLACSFWLADSLSSIGRAAEAVELFERLLALRNDVGLLAEEYDPRLGRMVGNVPQAFSHVGLVNTAHNLEAGRALHTYGR
jgi:GH15 family glucan-1,4-alpha-glucosidase